MKVPYKWLLEYVDIKKDINEVADALTLSGSKVEEVIDTGKDISKVVTGRLESITRHPDADKLVVCQVNVGEQIIQIVTGADNVKEGDVVPVALHGSTLPGGVKIKKGKLRGVESNGMLCSEAELGIADESSVHGILILPQGTPIGKDVKELLGLSGGIIDFEITSNRSDCFGVYGIAREAAATFDLPLKKLETSYKESSEDINDHLKVEVKDGLCRRYAAKMVKNIKIAPSPEWMQQQLKDAGVRPINNIVDITNYVMIELGQPMHAFDYRDIEDKTIIVRRADENEPFRTLDGQDRKLDSSMLVIADGKKAVGIAGVMGGENSEIKEDTVCVVFEIANFKGTNIRMTAKKLGLRTDASSKYEKDIDPNLVELALARACHLIEQLGAGEIVGGTIDIYNEKLLPCTIEVDADWINTFLGLDVEHQHMRRIFENLEIKVEGEKPMKLTIPTFRQDLKIREDIAEEVARMYGYDIIPSITMHGQTVEAAWTREQKLEKVVKDSLVSSGLYEIMTYTFVSPKIFDSIRQPVDSPLRNVVKISNPLGEDFSIMKTTSMASMLECLGRNYAKDNKEVKLFEVARIYKPTEETLPDERDVVSIGMYGKVDFYTMKGAIESLLSDLGIEKAEFVRETENPVFHPGRCAKLLIRKKEAGTFGEVHPLTAENYGFEDDRVYLAELDINQLYQACKMEKSYKQLPKFPAVTRDLAMLIKDEVPVGEIESIILRIGKGLLESVELFDVYKGKQIPDGMKSVAYALVYRAENRTLKDEEVNKVHEAITKALNEKLGAQLR